MTLIDFEKTLQAAKNTRQINAALKYYLNNLSIDTFSFTYYSYHPNSQNKLKYEFSSNNFNAWHQHYISEGYEDVDSTLTVVHKTTLPTFWDLEQQLKDAKTERERQMRLDSIEFGAERGLSIPIHGANEDFAVLLAVQMKGQTCLNDWKNKQYELLAAAHYYYHYLHHALLRVQTPIGKYQLTEQEMQCLLLIAEHRSMTDMARILEITERTVNYHIQKINKKLGTKNKYQSVTKALEKGLLTL